MTSGRADYFYCIQLKVVDQMEGIIRYILVAVLCILWSWGEWEGENRVSTLKMETQIS